MKPLMSKVDLENFLEKEFPQVSSNTLDLEELFQALQCFF